jgi:hypothetical protein
MIPNSRPPWWQPLPEKDWDSTELRQDSAERGPVVIDGGLRVRCSMRTCPGQLGQVVRIRYLPGEVVSFVRYEYQAPRGFRREHEQSDILFGISKRAQDQNRLGMPLRGKRPHKGKGDWDGTSPLKPFELPGDTWNLGETSGRDASEAVFVRCPTDHCERVVRFTTVEIEAELDKRSGTRLE